MLPNPTKPNQTKPNQTKPNQTKPIRCKPRIILRRHLFRRGVMGRFFFAFPVRAEPFDLAQDRLVEAQTEFPLRQAQGERSGGRSCLTLASVPRRLIPVRAERVEVRMGWSTLLPALLVLALLLGGCSDSSTGGSSKSGDTTAPTLAVVTAVPSATTDTTPSFTFSSSESGTIGWWGSCTGSTNTAYPGNNNITFNTLNEGTYSDCSLTVTDAASNVSSSLSVGTFKVDTTTPTVSEVTAVPTPTMDTTPSYTFNVSEVATISYGGSCSSSTTSASSGNNTVSFNTLSEGTYSNCTITVTDSAGNSSTLSVSSFTVKRMDPTAWILVS